MVDLATPQPGPGEVLVRVAACGICHTDLHVVEGELPPHRPRVVPGHQAVGRVVAAGPGVAGEIMGQRVGVPWLHRSCGACRFCTTGRENLCVQARFTGYDVDGGFADHLIAAADFVVPLPAGVPDTAAAPLLCAGVIGFRALRLTAVGRGDRLGLFGFGASAHLTTQVAVHRGVRVYAFSRGEGHRRLAASLGAAWTGQAGDDPGRPLDAAIIFAPAGELVPPALDALDRGGRLVLAGIYMTPVPALEYHRLYQERSIQSVANATRQDAMEFMAAAAAAGVRPEVEAFPLAAANGALRRLKAGAVQGAGVLVMD